MIGARAYALARASVLGGALFGLVAHGLLLAGCAVSAWWIPLCLGGAFGLAWRTSPMVGEDAAGVSGAPPRWLPITVLVVLGICVLAVGFGAVATPDRAWDGIVAWGIKAAALTADPILDQPFFADPAVLHHSPDYPLLQPLCLAVLGQVLGEQGARVLFPGLLVLLVVLVGVVVARRTRDRAVGWIVALAVGTTPFFTRSHGGGADSGYAELFLAVAVTAGAVGLLLGDSLMLASAAMTLPWIKPEGSVLLAGLLVVCFIAVRTRLWHAALGGGLVAFLLWLPLQLQLGHRPVPGPWLALGTLAAFAVPALGRFVLDRSGVARRGRTWCFAVLAFAGAIALVGLQDVLAAQNSPLLGQYLGSLARAGERLADLPAILAGLASHAFRPNRFGLTFVVLALALVVSARRRGVAVGTAPLLLWMGLGCLAIVAAFLLSPEPDLGHHLRSSAARLFAHWVGVAWLVVGIVWGRGRDAAQPSSN